MEASVAYTDEPAVEVAVEVERDEYADTLKRVLCEILIHEPARVWNEAVRAIREEDPDWYPDLSGMNLNSVSLSDRNLSRADFTDASITRTSFYACDLTGANFTRADMYRASFEHADVTGSNYKEGSDWSSAYWSNCAGYTPPLPDVTEAVARAILREAIADKNSIVNEGLDALRESGIRAQWVGDRLKFWMTHEIEEQRSPCHDGDCHCEVEHACHGDCSCCSCYTGDCDCEPDHDYEDYAPTDNYYLATVIGHIEYRWDSYGGLRGDISMSPDTLHPHVQNGGTVCWGNAIMPRSLRAADYLLTIMGWIGQHNPASEYRPISDLPHIY